MNDTVEFLSAVLIYSNNASRLAEFYRDVLGLPLVEEQHDSTPIHYGCELGDVHFAIHPAPPDQRLSPESGHQFRLAFTIFSTAALLKRLERRGIRPTSGPKQTSFATFTAVTDPDGNYVEFTELADAWFEHLSKRRAQGFDVISQWQRQRSVRRAEASED